MIAGTLLSYSERTAKRVTAERDKFWGQKLEVERKKAEEAERKKAAEQMKFDLKLVRKFHAKGWQDAEIAETLELDLETVRLYAGSEPVSNVG
jgi:predicted transposase YdaD